MATRGWLLILGVWCVMHVNALQVTNLTCELLVEPSAVNAPNPRFGWQITSNQHHVLQLAYHIQVRCVLSSKVVWNSGKIRSSESQHVPYNGMPLLHGQLYRWRVRVWDNQQRRSQWSSWTHFRLAPDNETLSASWIGAIRAEEARIPIGVRFLSSEMRTPGFRAIWANVDSLSRKSILLRKTTVLPKKNIAEAVAYISGLGHYELTINGKKVGESEFAPLWSDYDRTVYYNTFTVTDFLQKGENVFGVMLGNGFYNVQGGRYTKLRVSFGAPTLFFVMRIRYTDGACITIRSNESWKWNLSPITFNDIYGGEDYDARKEIQGWNHPYFQDNDWQRVVRQTPPRGTLTPQLAEPVKIMKRYARKSTMQLTPAQVDSTTRRTRRRVHPSTFVFDMGQNMAGFPEIKVKGNAGQTITLVVAEALTPEGAPDQSQTGRHHLYHYTLSGSGEEIWHPRFSYYGFRYIQVEGVVLPHQANPNNLPTLLDLHACFVHQSAPRVSSFETSNTIFNQTHDLIRHAVKSNMQAVFTDCPHREKLGWLEQVHLNGPGLMYNFRLTGLIPKVMQDIADAQLPNGMVPTIAPMYNIFGTTEGFDAFGDSPEWGSTFLILPWIYYQFYGDSTLIAIHYESMKKYAYYLKTKANEHILSHGLGDWYDYGDFKAGFSRNTPVPLVATAYYYYGLTCIARAARMLGQHSEEQYFKQWAEEVRGAFNRHFFDPATAIYGSGSQTSHALPLYLQMVDAPYRERVMNHLLNDIRKRGYRLTTGDIGNRYLFQTLAQNNQNEIMYKMHNHQEVPGYGFQLLFGATTLTEQWDPRRGSSWNHFMMGQIDEWFFASLVGLQPAKPGFREIHIQPAVVGDLTFVRGTFQSIYGEIDVHWEKTGKLFQLYVEIPVNCTANIFLPGELMPQTVGSGKHTFETTLP